MDDEGEECEDTSVLLHALPPLPPVLMVLLLLLVMLFSLRPRSSWLMFHRMDAGGANAAALVTLVAVAALMERTREGERRPGVEGVAAPVPVGARGVTCCAALAASPLPLLPLPPLSPAHSSSFTTATASE